MDNQVNKKFVKEYFLGLQTKIVEAIEIVDGKNFLNDSWKRNEGGGGTTCILENGNIFERAGIGFSHVTGSRLPKSATDAHPDIAPSDELSGADADEDSSLEEDIPPSDSLPLWQPRFRRPSDCSMSTGIQSVRRIFPYRYKCCCVLKRDAAT